MGFEIEVYGKTIYIVSEPSYEIIKTKDYIFIVRQASGLLDGKEVVVTWKHDDDEEIEWNNPSFVEDKLTGKILF